MRKLFKPNRINIYSIEPVVAEEPSFDSVLEVTETAIEAVAENLGLTYWQAFREIEQKMDEIRDKLELRYRVRKEIDEYEKLMEQGRRYERTGRISEFYR